MLSEKAFNSKKTLKEFKLKIDPIKHVLLKNVQDSISGKFGQETSQFVDIFIDIATRQSKNLRGSLVYYFHKLNNGFFEKESLQMASVIEFIHAYLLVVDDFMDKSFTRRHGLTAHERVKEHIIKSGYKQKDIEHVSNSVAVNIGLIANHVAFKILADINIDPLYKIKIFKSINSELITTGVGQLTDMLNEVKPAVTEKDIIEMLSWKTGAYTFENPIHTGMLLAGVSDDKEFDEISLYAIPAGIAFQIQDDVLGIFGESSSTGKSNLDDLLEGKITILVQHARSKVSSDQLTLLNKVLGNKQASIEDQDNVKQLFIDLGSLDYSISVAQKYKDIALDNLQKAKKDEWNKDSYEYIYGLTEYIVNREK